MELPTTGSADKLRQQVEGKLAERDNCGVQVIQETPQVETVLWLVDADGVFLQTAPSHRHKDSGESDRACQELKEENAQLHEELSAVQQQLEEERSHVVLLREQLEEHMAEPSAGLAAEVERLKADLEAEKAKRQQLWKTSCGQVAEQDALLTAKDDELAALRARVAALSASPVPPGGEEEDDNQSLPGSVHPPLSPSRPQPPRTDSSRARRGKAPPVDSFLGENVEVQLDDWLPALERASSWNGWSEDDKLLQLAGHLRGRALQEWNLIADDDKSTYSSATEALRARLDPGNKTLAAQDFRHTLQGNEEKVTDFIHRLERTFRVAYGRDGLPASTHDALLHG